MIEISTNPHRLWILSPVVFSWHGHHMWTFIVIRIAKGIDAIWIAHTHTHTHIGKQSIASLFPVYWNLGQPWQTPVTIIREARTLSPNAKITLLANPDSGMPHGSTWPKVQWSSLTMKAPPSWSWEPSSQVSLWSFGEFTTYICYPTF